MHTDSASELAYPRFPVRLIWGLTCLLVVATWNHCGRCALGQPSGSADSAFDLNAVKGSWSVLSATRDGAPAEQFKTFRYFIEPELMRWADPNKRSSATNLPLLMGRRLTSQGGNKFSATTIFPPGAASEVEFRLEGSELVIITDRTPGKDGLVLRLKQVNSDPPRPNVDKMVTLARDAAAVGRWDAAYQFAQLQLINFPDNEAGIALLGQASMGIALESKQGLDVNAITRARDQASWALSELPEDNTLRLQYANFLFRTREFAAASTQFDQLKQRSALEAEGLVTYAQSEVLQGRVDAAKGLLEQATGFNTAENSFGDNVPEEPNSGFLTLAILLMKMGNTQQGYDLLDSFVDRFPGSPIPYLHRGRFHILNQDRDKGRADFQQALQIAPTSRDALLVNIEGGLQDEGDETEKLIESYFEQHPPDPLALTLAAARASIKKDYTKALAYTEEGLALAPNNLNLFGLMVQLRITLKQFEEASALIERMPSIGFHAVSADLMRARMFVAEDRLDEAEVILNRLGQIDIPEAAQNQFLDARELLSEAKRKRDAAP